MSTLAHGLTCFARLVRLLLGNGAIACEKLGYGASLCVLGVQHKLFKAGYKCFPSADKVWVWQRVIATALREGRLDPGEAAKLAGRLSWGCSQLFHRFGRAMLRPIFDQQSRRDGKVDVHLKRALMWWQEVLRLGVCELRAWEEPEADLLQLFCDARGNPPHLGAVLFWRGKCWWTHMRVEASMLGRFRSRRDNQIMGLELHAKYRF